jgi:poly(beta-D-mannuronate) lyase
LAESGGGSGDDGTVFRVTLSGVLTALVSFDGANGDGPIANLVQGSDGNFYGTTETGGVSDKGVIFQLIVPPSTTAPTFSPAAGAYTSAQTVTISTTTSGATIRYTTDGSIPTETTGTLYAGPISISSSMTLKAVAYEAGFTDSPVTSGTYTITLPAAPVSPASGGGGGGAPSYWFFGALALAALLRWKLGQKMPGESQKS